MTKPTVAAVVFDIGGVLELTPDTGLADRWERRLGLTPGELDARLQAYWDAGEIGDMTEGEVYRAVQDELGVSDGSMHAFWADVWTEYLGTPNTQLIGYFADLRPRCKTGLLSNSFVGAREREQARYGFADLTDTIVYSHEVGLRKPDPRIYELLCARLGARPSDVILLDDSAFAVDGAVDAGMTGLLYTGNADAIQAIDDRLDR